MSGEPIFSGDGHCPFCHVFVFLEWQKEQRVWQCRCGHRLDIRDTIAMLASYRPERNSADLNEVKRRIRHNLGLPVIPPKPVARSSQRSFWHPKEFALNFAVGTAMEVGWRLMGVVRDVVGQIGAEDE